METASIRGPSSTFIDAGTKLCANTNWTDTSRGMHRMKKQESTGNIAQK